MEIFMKKKISKLPFKGTAEQEAQLKAVIAEKTFILNILLNLDEINI